MECPLSVFDLASSDLTLKVWAFFVFRHGAPRGGMRVAARIGDRLRREIRRGRRPRVGDG